MNIQEHCRSLNHLVHERIFLNNFLSKERNHERTFTSLDLIEDCQDAIEEFLEVEKIKHRSTLYIYGVLQAMYCQQDGLFHLYKTIADGNIKNVYELFRLNHFPEKIREVRDDIAGHPTDRKKGKEFYFIAKGSNTKFKFTYAGYTPEFRVEEVDLSEFILSQHSFCKKVLEVVEEKIHLDVKIFKDKFKDMKLIKLLDGVDRNIQLVYEGIHSDKPLASLGQEELQKVINNVRSDLTERYGQNIPESVECILRLQQHSVNKIKQLLSEKSLYKNIDAEIYMDSFEHQLLELEEILNEIDDDFSS